MDLLPYSSFGDNTQKKQFENLYKKLVSYPDIMKTKGKELEEIFMMLSEKNLDVFSKMEQLEEDNSKEKEE